MGSPPAFLKITTSLLQIKVLLSNCCRFSYGIRMRDWAIVIASNRSLQNDEKLAPRFLASTWHTLMSALPLS